MRFRMECHRAFRIGENYMETAATRLVYPYSVVNGQCP